MAEIIVSYGQDRESWGDPNVIIWVDNFNSFKRTCARNYAVFSPFIAQLNQTPFELIDDIKKYILEKTGEYPTSRLGACPEDIEERDIQAQYGSGLHYGPLAFWPRIATSEEENDREIARIKKRNALLPEIIFPVFSNFVIEKGLVELVR